MNERGKQLAVWGIALQIGGLVGLGITIVGVVRAFEDVSRSGAFSAAELASATAGELVPAVIGVLLSLTGAVLLLCALFGSRYRAPWFHTTMWILAVLWLFNVPVGTVLGIIVIAYLVKHREEFIATRSQLYRKAVTDL